ncbi:hypothetical protein PCANC_28554, partial [Puccinia coronata f. sp. avenae]
MKSYFLILFLVGTTLAASGLSDGLTRRKISSEIGEDFEHSIDRSDDEGWQLVINRSNEGSCAGRSSSEWDSEHVTDSDREDALGDVISAEIDDESRPKICEICRNEIENGERSYQEAAWNCGHLFHSTCIPRRSSRCGYKCPRCQGPSGIALARKQLRREN